MSYKELLAYQAEDARMKKLEDELAKSDVRAKYVTSKKFLDTVGDSLSKLENRAVDLTNAYRRAADDAKELTDALADFDDLEEGGSREEVEYLAKRASELCVRLQHAVAEAERIDKEIKEANEAYLALAKKTKEMSATYNESKKAYGELKEKVRPEKEAIEARLRDLAAAVPPAEMEMYAQKRASKIFPVLVKLYDNSCACGMELPLSERHRLDAGEIVECGNCRRMVYKE